eukprot:gene7450-8716_t
MYLRSKNKSARSMAIASVVLFFVVPALVVAIYFIIAAAFLHEFNKVNDNTFSSDNYSGGMNYN